MSKLVEQLATAAAGHGGVTLASTGDRRSWSEVHDAALRVAPILNAAVGNDRSGVAILANTSLEVVVLVQAAVIAGVPLTMLQPPGRAESIESYRIRLSKHLGQIDASVILVDGSLLDWIGGLTLNVQVKEIETFVVERCQSSARLPALTETSIAFRHFTSGSTGEPVCVDLTHAGIADHIDALRSASNHDEIHDRIVSWLPLYHDMGLFGFLFLPMICGSCELVLSDPQRFLKRPLSWLEDLSAYHATATAAPNFAYALLGRFKGARGPISLQSLRFCLSGAERITDRALESFSDAYHGSGFNRRSLVAAYGLAEAVLAVTMSEVGEGIIFDRRGVQNRALLGRTIPRTDLRVVDKSGVMLSDGSVGSVEIRSPSLSPSVHLTAGWYHTGDIGYCIDGQLVICGREREMVIRAGQNYYAEDIELAILDTPGIRPGGVAAVRQESPDGADVLLLVAELAQKSVDAIQLKRGVRAALLAGLGIVPDDVRIVPPGTIPRTPSGKIQRLALSRRILESDEISATQ